MGLTSWKSEDAYKVLRRDPVLKKIIQATGELSHGKNRDIYYALLQSITSQQLSAKAGDTIFGRFLDLFPEGNPVPEKVVKMKVEKLRGAGLSFAKADYLKNIAEFAITNGFEYRKLNKMDDPELLAHLTSIKGVGRWTAEMILMFTMNRPDILPVDDVGIRNEMRSLYKLNGEGKILSAQMEEVSIAWKPYRTLACRHLWRYRDTIVK